jgi:hypothetical protein
VGGASAVRDLEEGGGPLAEIRFGRGIAEAEQFGALFRSESEPTAGRHGKAAFRG